MILLVPAALPSRLKARWVARDPTQRRLRKLSEQHRQSAKVINA
jgi:hypothetical protein